MPYVSGFDRDQLMCCSWDAFVDKESIAKDFKVELKNEVTKMPLFNVAGVIPGKSKAKELVVFGGHYDHKGIVKPKEIGGDSIMNGADDDASGTSAMIALAKYYKKLNNNERRIRTKTCGLSK